ncbi:MAG: hypothetical protein M1833_003081 [Piccolia ochrophora]|nr:MAG: hypothetical protein M1833_003081 [Piccolia ochrophora]
MAATTPTINGSEVDDESSTLSRAGTVGPVNKCRTISPGENNPLETNKEEVDNGEDGEDDHEMNEVLDDFAERLEKEGGHAVTRTEEQMTDVQLNACCGREGAGIDGPTKGNVLVGTNRLLGTVYTITAATSAVMFSPQWIKDDEKQAEARIRRIGQTHPTRTDERGDGGAGRLTVTSISGRVPALVNGLVRDGLAKDARIESIAALADNEDDSDNVAGPERQPDGFYEDEVEVDLQCNPFQAANEGRLREHQNATFMAVYQARDV